MIRLTHLHPVSTFRHYIEQGPFEHDVDRAFDWVSIFGLFAVIAAVGLVIVPAACIILTR